MHLFFTSLFVLQSFNISYFLDVDADCAGRASVNQSSFASLIVFVNLGFGFVLTKAPIAALRMFKHILRATYMSVKEIAVIMINGYVWTVIKYSRKKDGDSFNNNRTTPTCFRLLQQLEGYNKFVICVSWSEKKIQVFSQNQTSKKNIFYPQFYIRSTNHPNFTTVLVFI